MNVLPRDKQIEIIAALTEGVSIRATERLTGVHRDTIMRLGVRVGMGCATLLARKISTSLAAASSEAALPRIEIPADIGPSSTS